MRNSQEAEMGAAGKMLVELQPLLSAERGGGVPAGALGSWFLLVFYS